MSCTLLSADKLVQNIIQVEYTCQWDWISMPFYSSLDIKCTFSPQVDPCAPRIESAGGWPTRYLPRRRPRLQDWPRPRARGPRSARRRGQCWFFFNKINLSVYFRFGFFRPSLRSWPGGWACPHEVGVGVTPLWTRGFCSDHLRVLCFCLSLLNIFYWTIITKYLITVLWSNLLSSVCTWWCRLSTSWYTRAARKTGTLPGLHTPLGLFQDLENEWGGVIGSRLKVLYISEHFKNRFIQIFPRVMTSIYSRREVNETRVASTFLFLGKIFINSISYPWHSNHKSIYSWVW